MNSIIWILSILFKLILVPSYYSTDFDVHRNWLAITTTLPREKWYYEDTNPWTLDYPPLFAWFEFLLGKLLFPPSELLVISKNSTVKLNFPSSVLWHRSTVILTETLFLSFAIYQYASTWPKERNNSETVHSKTKLGFVTALIAFDPNLLYLDHIHFQYNGFLLSILILAFAALRNEQPLLGAFYFAVLLMLKHIFLYAAPVFFIYLFRHYCFPPFSFRSVLYLFRLGLVVLIVFFLSLFSVMDASNKIDSLLKVFSRLFPVNERGLLHAYWAPNFWALYAFTDKTIGYALKKETKADAISSSMGLVNGTISFAVLPSVPPLATFCLSFLFMLPPLVQIFKTNSPNILLHAYVCVVFASLFFGWHVHEKALAMITIPLAFSAVDSVKEAKNYLMLTWITNVALSPLLFPLSLSVLKAAVLFFHVVWSLYAFNFFHANERRKRSGGMLASFSTVDLVYLAGLVFCFGFYEYAFAVEFLLFRSTRLKERFPFVPLMIVSTYCSVGVLYCWVEAFRLLKKKQKAIISSQPSPILLGMIDSNPIVNKIKL